MFPNTFRVRLRQRSPDDNCIPVVMRDTISFLAEQGDYSSPVVETRTGITNDWVHWRNGLSLSLVLLRFGDRGDLQTLSQCDAGEGGPAQIQLR